MRYLAVGATHKTAPLALRERLAVDESATVPLLALLAPAGVGQALVLATCDRVEAFVAADDPEAVVPRIVAAFAGHGGLAAAEIEPFVRTLTDDAALGHLAAVAAGLDSLVLGEPEVLGQVKAAAGHARAAGLVGPELGRWVDWALRTAGRVRSETTIGERPVSLAAAALGVARSIHGDLAGCSGLVIGSGEAADLVARAFKDGGLGRIAVSHPNERRVAALAQRLGANVVPFERLDAALAGADIVVSALGSGRVVLTKPGLEAARRARRRQPIFVVDLAMPPDVDGAADELEDVYVFRLDDLERVAEEGRASRQGAREAAEAIVVDAVAEFRRAGVERQAVPAIVALRRAFEAERDRLLAEHPGLDAATATRLLVQRLLHGPSTALRAMAGAGDDLAAVEALVARLFEATDDRRTDTDETE